MKILQISGDWKWTGPAEPMLLLLRALRERGHEVELVCPAAATERERSLAGEARRVGVVPVHTLAPGRGIRPWRDTPDARWLRTWVEGEGIEIVHVWHSRDHALALRATSRRRRAGTASLVRSHPGASTIAATPWNRWFFGPGCDGLLCVSPESARRNARLRGGRPVAGCLGTADPDRFPALGPAPGSGAAARAALGLGPDQLVIGIAARVQRHRRFDLLFEAMAELARQRPDARLLVMGRGTHFDELARRPVERLGLGDRVILAGHRTLDYPALLGSLDVFTLLVPGSDGTCRALLEASLCGVPSVATRRGPLPEIVLDGETGLLVDERPADLAAAWQRLLDDAPLRRKLGAAARSRAERLFVPDRFAADVERFYASVLAAPSSSARLSVESETSSR